jgi:hypothetical protein
MVGGGDMADEGDGCGPETVGNVLPADPPHAVIPNETMTHTATTYLFMIFLPTREFDSLEIIPLWTATEQVPGSG